MHNTKLSNCLSGMAGDSCMGRKLDKVTTEVSSASQSPILTSYESHGKSPSSKMTGVREVCALIQREPKWAKQFGQVAFEQVLTRSILS